MGKYPPIPVRLNLKDDVVRDGTLFQKDEVIDSVMCYNIWVKLDTALETGQSEMSMRDPRVRSMEILEHKRTHQGHFDE